MNPKANVDFVVGTQYGDEGKGMVAKLMADKAEMEGNPFEWTARVGAQNAEHRFVHDACDLCARILPSAAAFRNVEDGHTPIQALLGAGHCFMPDHLVFEATHLGIPTDRIWVDPLAMWLREFHATKNRDVGDKRGTTGWGVGAATSAKVGRSPDVELIGACPELKDVLGSRLTKLGPIMDTQFGGRGLFEGSQGFMLSLNHGRYPWSTAKDVTITNMCSELGLSHKRIGKVTGVVRLVFMRVSGPSGPTGGQELSYDEVEQRTGLRFPNHKRLQGDSMKWTSTDGKSAGVTDEERLFDFSMEELKYSHSVNAYDQLAITFADMHRAGNYRVRTWADLHPDTKDAIIKIENELDVPVVLIRTGQGEHDNIWRTDPDLVWERQPV